MTKRFSASSAAQLMQCPGSADLESAIPGYVAPVVDPTKGAKGLGTSVHAAVEYLLNLIDDAFPEVYYALEVYLRLHWRKRRAIVETPQTIMAWILDTEQASGIANYYRPEIVGFFELIKPGNFAPATLRFIHETVGRIVHIRGNLPGATGQTEMKMTATWLRTKPGTTADYVLWNKREIYVFDVKNGKIPVYATDNKQLLYYLKTALVELSRDPAQFDEMVVWILQPGNEDYWVVTPKDLEDFTAKALAAEERIIRKDLTLRPGDSCTFCPANPHSRGDKGSKMCPAMMAVLYPPVIDEDEILNM